jgi:hypothetical protein
MLGRYHHHGRNARDFVSRVATVRWSRGPLRPNPAEIGPGRLAPPTVVGVSRPRRRAPPPRRHASSSAAGHRLARREVRASRGTASVVGSTASPAASSEARGGRKEGGRGRPMARTRFQG